MKKDRKKQLLRLLKEYKGSILTESPKTGDIVELDMRQVKKVYATKAYNVIANQVRKYGNKWRVVMIHPFKATNYGADIQMMDSNLRQTFYHISNIKNPKEIQSVPESCFIK